MKCSDDFTISFNIAKTSLRVLRGNTKGHKIILPSKSFGFFNHFEISIFILDEMIRRRDKHDLLRIYSHTSQCDGRCCISPNRLKEKRGVAHFATVTVELFDLVYRKKILFCIGNDHMIFASREIALKGHLKK